MQVWLSNFKAFLEKEHLDSKMPQKVENYLQGLVDSFTKKIAEEKEKVRVLEKQNQILTKVIGDLSLEKAKEA